MFYHLCLESQGSHLTPVAGVGSVTGVLLADVGSANQGTAPLATRGWDEHLDLLFWGP